MATKEMQKISDVLGYALDELKKAGADQARVSYSVNDSTEVTVRMKEVENLTASRSLGLGLTAWQGARRESTSLDSVNLEDIKAAAQELVRSLASKPEVPEQLPPDPSQVAKIQNNKALDLYDPTRILSEELIEDALMMERAALGVPKVANSDGASASSTKVLNVVLSTYGYNPVTRETGQYRAVSVIAEDNGAMQPAYDSSYAVYDIDLDNLIDLGRNAGEKAVRALNPQKATAGAFPVVFHPDVARGLLSHFSSAANGTNLRKKETFLELASLDTRVFAPGIVIVDDPFLKRGHGSTMMTGDGLAAARKVLVEDGVLRKFFLNLEESRRLNMPYTGGSTNLMIEPGELSEEALIADIKDGFYVTSLMGQGVQITSGNYSRGAKGFWIKNGEIAYPVEGATIAGNLRDMFLNMRAANNMNPYRQGVPTLRVEGLKIS